LKEGGLEPARGFSPAGLLRAVLFSSHYNEVRKYRRRLPHLDIPGSPVFVTWRLWGSLPQEHVFSREEVASGEAFAALDRLLDTARSGPVYLRRPEIADLVSQQLRVACSKGLCSLHAYAVMPNHVHVLWTPEVSLPVLVRRVKGPTARSANQLLGRAGKPFWQEEYFDRIVRTETEFCQILRYIEWNPVRAALVSDPEEFPWSSAFGGLKSRAG
jgi:putative DNA methylase